MFYTELEQFNTTYEEHLQSGKASDKTMFSLSWDIEELKNISTEGRRLRVELSSTLDTVSTADADFQQLNVAQKITSIRERLGALVKEATRFK